MFWSIAHTHRKMNENDNKKPITEMRKPVKKEKNDQRYNDIRRNSSKENQMKACMQRRRVQNEDKQML